MKQSERTLRTAVTGMLLAVILTLSWLEHLLPPLPALPPGVRLGLSNVVTMYAVFYLGRRTALLLGVLKSVFVLLMRGWTAGMLSLCGGLLSILVIVLLTALLRERISWLMLSICGAMAHNLGQILIASVLLGTALVLYYLPVLLISGVIMGSVTGSLLRVAVPVLGRTLSKPGTGRNE